MKIEFNRPTIYMSHPIRGTSGDIEGNCKKAATAARRLRRVFPEVDFYVPAEHDLTLQILTAENMLSISDIMFADLTILRACHGWMYYSFELSTGSKIEMEHACKFNIANGSEIFYYDIEKLSYPKIRKDFSGLVERTLERFRNSYHG